jgi:hypothetical protein
VSFGFDEDAALQRLGEMVHALDVGGAPVPEAIGLHAISLGLSRKFDDDHEQLRYGMVVYDALYAWCQGDART